MNATATRLLDLVADLCWLAQERPAGASALAYAVPAATALRLAVRAGARGERVQDMAHWLKTLSAGGRWEAAA